MSSESFISNPRVVTGLSYLVECNQHAFDNHCSYCSLRLWPLFANVTSVLGPFKELFLVWLFGYYLLDVFYVLSTQGMSVWFFFPHLIWIWFPRYPEYWCHEWTMIFSPFWEDTQLRQRDEITCPKACSWSRHRDRTQRLGSLQTCMLILWSEFPMSSPMWEMSHLLYQWVVITGDARGQDEHYLEWTLFWTVSWTERQEGIHPLRASWTMWLLKCFPIHPYSKGLAHI